MKIVIVAALAVAVVGAVALKNRKPTPAPAPPAVAQTGPAAVGPAKAEPSPGGAKPLPKLLDLGAGTCIPCKMMAPILKELKKEYAGKMDVEVIDVREHPEAGKTYGIEMIPTQIFYDAEGKERFRHVGFFGKEDILGKWKELGVDISGGKPSAGIIREEPVKAEPAIPEPARTEAILIEAFLPLGSGCMGPMVEHLNGLEKKYAGRIKVAYTDFSQPKGLKAMEARGFHCLTILVNGADRFTVKNPDGTERETWFNKPPEAGNWKLEDLDQVISTKTEALFPPTGPSRI